MTRRWNIDTEAYVSTGQITTEIIASSKTRDIFQIAQETWPDLQPNDEIVLIPRNDLEIIVGMTKGRVCLKVRPFCTLTMPHIPRHSRYISFVLKQLILLSVAYAVWHLFSAAVYFLSGAIL